MNTYNWYIGIFYYNRWQNIVNIFNQFIVKHLTYICHSLSRFKFPIANDIHYYPTSIQNVFFTFTYNLRHAWRRNLVGYIIKFLTTSRIFLMRGSSNCMLLKTSYSSSRLFCASKNTQPPYIIIPCNEIIPRLSFFRVQPPLLPHHLHNPLFSQHPLLKMWRAVGLLHLLQLLAIAVIRYVKTSGKNHEIKHVI